MLQRYAIFALATVIQSAGIALVVKSLLGTSPISSFPYVLSLILPHTLGECTLAVNMLMLLGQVLLLRHDFDRIQWLQVPMTLLFSCAIDFFMGVWSFVTPNSYFWQLVPLVCGTTFIALGVSLQGIANVLMLPGEGIVYAVARRFRIPFGKVKTANDVLLVCLAAICSFSYLGSIEGIREGTLFSALVTGIIAQFFLHHLSQVDAQGRLCLRNPFASKRAQAKAMQTADSAVEN